MRKPPQFKDHPMDFPKSVDYRGVCHYVTDGDTIDALIDLGMYEYSYKTIRIEGFDAPEIRKYKDLVTQEEIEHGHAAKEHLEYLVLDRPIKITTGSKMSLSRVVARVFYWDTDYNIWVNVADKMTEDGFAKRDRPYYT